MKRLAKRPLTKADGLELTSGAVAPTNSQSPAKPGKPASVSKGAETNRPSRAINTTALAADHVNFMQMSEESVDKWVEVVLKAVKCHPNTKECGKKAILQKIFGGFDFLTDDDQAYWLENDKHFKGKKNSVTDLVAVLKERTKKCRIWIVEGH